MSYFASSFNRRSQPYVESDANAMVPGWGMNLQHAGPPMIAVGTSPDGLGVISSVAFQKAIKLSQDPCALAFAQEKSCANGQLSADVCGQAASKAYDCRTAGQPPPVAEDPMNYWIWIASGGIILGAIGLFAYNQGWIGGKKTATANSRTYNKHRRGHGMASSYYASKRKRRRMTANQKKNT